MEGSSIRWLGNLDNFRVLRSNMWSRFSIAPTIDERLSFFLMTLTENRFWTSVDQNRVQFECLVEKSFCNYQQPRIISKLLCTGKKYNMSKNNTCHKIDDLECCQSARAR